jgi:hypothetical protein
LILCKRHVSLELGTLCSFESIWEKVTYVPHNAIAHRAL